MISVEGYSTPSQTDCSSFKEGHMELRPKIGEGIAPQDVLGTIFTNMTCHHPKYMMKVSRGEASAQTQPLKCKIVHLQPLSSQTLNPKLCGIPLADS